VEDSQDAREEVLLPAYRVTGKPEVNFSIADNPGAINQSRLQQRIAGLEGTCRKQI